MADPNLQFDPVTGWNNSDTFKTNPTSNAEARSFLQRLHDQTRDFINNNLISWINTIFATKSDLNGVIAGQINTTDSVTGKKYAIIIENGLLGMKEV